MRDILKPFKDDGVAGAIPSRSRNLGGTDSTSFNQAGLPGIGLVQDTIEYGSHTWHTNLDTYDKIVFDDVRSNAILTAILAYMASEDEEKTSREKALLPIDPKTGEPGKWPEQKSPSRKGGLD